MLGLGTSIGSNALGDVAYTPAILPPPPPIPPPPVPLPTLILDQGGLQPQVHGTVQGPTLNTELTSEPLNVDFKLDGGGLVLIPGLYNSIIIPTWTRILGWSIVGDLIGSIIVDFYQITTAQALAGALPTAANSICGGNFPISINTTAAKSTNVLSWSRDIAQYDILTPNIIACQDYMHATITLYTQRRRLQ